MEEYKILPHPHIGIDTLEMLPQKTRSFAINDTGMDPPGSLSDAPCYSIYLSPEPEDNLCR